VDGLRCCFPLLLPPLPPPLLLHLLSQNKGKLPSPIVPCARPSVGLWYVGLSVCPLVPLLACLVVCL
jgi:hypothetical protein